MRTTRDMALEFHRVFGHPIHTHPLSVEQIKLRIKLIEEETKELVDELWNYAQTGIISPNLLKERGDVQYVLDGLDVALGVDAVEITSIVHDSNMTKLGPDGKPIYREDGKVLKGPNYTPPDLSHLVPV